MSEKNRVEVIMPVYNPSSWVFEAIDSVLNQTYDNCFLTVIDDSSIERKYIKKLKKYLKNEEKASFYLLKENIGAAGARNEAARKTDARYICFIDQDDRYKKYKVEKQVEVLKQKGAKLAHGNIVHIDEKGEYMGEGVGNDRRNKIEYNKLSGEILARELFKVNSLRIGTVMIEREAFLDVGGFDSNLFGGEEWEFWVRFSINYIIAHIPEIIYEKRVHVKQVSSTHSKERVYGQLQALTKMEKNYKFLTDLARKKRNNFVRKLAKLEILDSNYTKARDVLKENFPKIEPSFKDYMLYFLTYCYKLNKYFLKIYEYCV